MTKQEKTPNICGAQTVAHLGVVHGVHWTDRGAFFLIRLMYTTNQNDRSRWALCYCFKHGHLSHFFEIWNKEYRPSNPTMIANRLAGWPRETENWAQFQEILLFEKNHVHFLCHFWGVLTKSRASMASLVSFTPILALPPAVRESEFCTSQIQSIYILSNIIHT